jgi:hypothetical protein
MMNLQYFCLILQQLTRGIKFLEVFKTYCFVYFCVGNLEYLFECLLLQRGLGVFILLQ